MSKPERLLPPPLSPIFNLNTDCCDHIFEYLALCDISSFGQTCKAMNSVAGEYIKRNYSAQWFAVNKNGVRSFPGLSQFVTKVEFSLRFSSSFYNSLLVKRTEEFSSIKCLKFDAQILGQNWWTAVKKILPKIEILNISTISLNYGTEFNSVNELCAKLLEAGANLQELTVNIPTLVPTLEVIHSCAETIQISKRSGSNQCRQFPTSLHFSDKIQMCATGKYLD